MALVSDRLGGVAFSAHHARLGTGLLKLELEAMNLSQVGCRWGALFGSVRAVGVSHSVTWSRAAQRALARDLPESVAAACLEFVLGALAENPQRVGKALRAPVAGLHSARRGDFRVIYRIEDKLVHIHVVSIQHRRDAYRA